MKKYFIPFAATLMLLSCEKPSQKEDNTLPEGMVPLTISAYTFSTKATSEASEDEEKIHNIQIFIYNNEEGGGHLEAKGKADAKSLYITSTRGAKAIYALVNVPVDYTTDAAVTNYGLNDSTNLRLLSTDLKDNARNSFIMMGRREYNVSKAVSLKIDVKRMVCKICLNKVTVDLDDAVKEEYPNASFFIKKIYLRNCVAEQDFTFANSDFWATSAKWYNKRKFAIVPEDGIMDPSSIDLISQEFNPMIEVTEGTPLTESYVFYAYPNGAGNDFNENAWTARRTCMVVVADVQYKLGSWKTDENKHFVIPIGAIYNETTGRVEGDIESNKKYNVTLTIKSTGNDADNDINPYTSNVNSSIRALAWEDVGTYDFESN